MTSEAAAPPRKKRPAVTFDMNDPAFDPFRVEQKLRKSHGVRQPGRKATEKQTASSSSNISSASTLVDPDAQQPDADVKAKGESGFFSGIFYTFSKMICGSSSEPKSVHVKQPVNTSTQPTHVDPPSIEASSELANDYLNSSTTSFIDDQTTDSFYRNDIEIHERKLRKTFSHETIVVQSPFGEIALDEISTETHDQFDNEDTIDQRLLIPISIETIIESKPPEPQKNLRQPVAVPIPVSENTPHSPPQSLVDRSRYVHSRVQSEPTIRLPTPEPEKETMQELIEASTEFFNVHPKQPKSMAQSVVLRRWEIGRKQRWEQWKNRREELLMVEEARRRRRRGFLRRLEMHPWVDNSTGKPGLSRSTSLQVQKKTTSNPEATGRVEILSRLRTFNKEDKEDKEDKEELQGLRIFERSRRVLKRSVSLGSYKELKSRWEPTRKMLCEYDGDGEEETVKSGADLFGLALVGSYWYNPPISSDPNPRQTESVINNECIDSNNIFDDDDSDSGSDCSDKTPRHQCFDGSLHSGMLDPPKQLGYWARFNAQDVLSTERENVRKLLAESLTQAGELGSLNSNPVAGSALEREQTNPRIGSLIGRLTARIKYLDLD